MEDPVVMRYGGLRCVHQRSDTGQHWTVWTHQHSQPPALRSQGHGLMRHEYVINSAHQENVLEIQSITADNLLRKTFMCHCLLHVC